MYAIEVKHQDIEGAKSYWFSVSDEDIGSISPGSAVMCRTKKGWQSGVTTGACVFGEEDKVKSMLAAAGATFPLKSAFPAAADAVMMSAIAVPRSMRLHAPNSYKILKRIREYVTDGCFHTPVLVSQDGVLMDGFSAYLTADALGHSTIPCWRISSKAFKHDGRQV